MNKASANCLTTCKDNVQPSVAVVTLTGSVLRKALQTVPSTAFWQGEFELAHVLVLLPHPRPAEFCLLWLVSERIAKNSVGAKGRYTSNGPCRSAGLETSG